MATNNICPDCDSILPTKATSCSCGWQQTEVKSTRSRNEKPVPDPTCICAWRDGQDQCPLPATVSNEATGGRWFCLAHARYPHDQPHNRQLWEWIDRQLDNRANQYREMLVNMHRSTRYWEKEGFNTVIKQNHESFVAMTHRAPGWFRDAGQRIRGIMVQLRKDSHA